MDLNIEIALNIATKESKILRNFRQRLLVYANLHPFIKKNTCNCCRFLLNKAELWKKHSDSLTASKFWQREGA